MDPSTSAAQDVSQQKQSDQSGVSPNANVASGPQQQDSTAQPVPQQPKKQQISITGGGGLEAGSGMVMAEDPDDDEDEDELQVAPQEKKNLGVMGQGGDDDEQQIVSQASVLDVSEVAEIQPSVPEVVAGSPEVEKLIEITPPEQPKISEELKNIGVTHSGPGFIDASQMNQPAPKMPVTYQQALNAEEQIKDNKVKSSKFWLLEKIKYLWRKVDPNISLGVKPQVTKVAPAKKLPVKTNAVPSSPVVPAKSEI